MDKQYLAINGALFFWLLALIAWSVDASALARLAAACALIAFLLHSQRNKINAMFIKKNKTEPQISEAATPPAINPEPEAVASKKHETTVIASGVHFVGNIVASGHVYIHGQVTGNIEAKEHLIKVMREGQVEKVPYLLVLGFNEVENNTVSYRLHGQADTTVVGLDEFVTKIEEEIKTKAKNR